MTKETIEKDVPIKNGNLKKNHLVTQSNEIIEAMYQVGLTAKKLMMSIISQIEPDDKDFKYYMIPVSDWKKLVGITGSKRDYFDILIKAANELRARSITIDMRDKTKVNLGLVSAVKDDKKRQMVGARFDAELKPYLLNLRRNFTSFSLEKVMKMRSVYSIRLYEILKSYRNKGIEKWTSPLESLRLKVGAIGPAYSTYGNFKKKVLDVAKRELPQKTDLRFEFSTLKEGRKISDIEFSIYSIPQKTEVKGLITDILKLIPDKSVKESEGICRKILKEKGEACLKWLVEYTNTKKYENYGAYLRFAYEKGLYDNYVEHQRIEEEILKKSAEITAAKRQEQTKKEHAEQETIDKEMYLNQLIRELSPEEEKELNKRALELLENEAKTDKGAKYRLERYLKFAESEKHQEKAIQSLYHYRLKLIKDLK